MWRLSYPQTTSDSLGCECLPLELRFSSIFQAARLTTTQCHCMSDYPAHYPGDACIRSSQRLLALVWMLQLPEAKSLEHI